MWIISFREGLTLREAVGVLELVKLDLWKEQIDGRLAFYRLVIPNFCNNLVYI